MSRWINVEAAVLQSPPPLSVARSPRFAALWWSLSLTATAFSWSVPASAQGESTLARVEKAHLSVERAPASAAAGTVVHATAVVLLEDGWHVNAHVPSLDYLIPTDLEVELPAGWPAATIDYPPSVNKAFAFADQPIDVYEGTFRVPLLIQVPLEATNGKTPLRVRLRYQACSDRVCLAPVRTEADFTLEVVGGAGSLPQAVAGTNAGTPPVAAQATAPAPAVASAARGWAGFLLLGFLGGLILNAMPCVLPVLSLKVFGIVRSASLGRRHLVVATLSTAAGIVASFAGLAAAAILARRAGSSVGWGVQFQEPLFVGFLAMIVILFCLNLWGLFEIQLPAFLRRKLDGATGGQPAEGPSGHFASGLFATLMATPCSAPFLGTAVGFALTQPPVTVVAVFLAIGLGMASPYLLLAAFPALASRFPRPGAWMETLKGAMGFLLAAAAIWLFFVLSAQTRPERLAFFQACAVGVALLFWLAARRPPGVAASVLRTLALVVAVGSVFLLRADGDRPSSSTGGAGLRAIGGVTWQAWKPGEPERLAALGKTVFVDVTADWCFTCKVNERLVLASDEVAAALNAPDVVALKADWTNPSREIGDYLASFGRYGIPFYAVYRPAQAPRALPEVLTKDLVLAALEGR
jgi:suppressor for copper-sensitivity B